MEWICDGKSVVKIPCHCQDGRDRQFYPRGAGAFYAQSSISKMVADLEQECMTLLERSKKAALPDLCRSAGAAVLRRLLQEQQALEGQISRMNGVKPASCASAPFPAWQSTGCRTSFPPRRPTTPGISYDKMEIRFMGMIVTSKAPGAIGPYSQGYAANGFVFVSG